jgi:hypothetical protein
LVAAAGALVAFAGLVWFLISQRNADERTWTRLAWVFSSVEAIAFGAAGALFGSSIQRQRAEQAEERATANDEHAANGRALAAALKAEDVAEASPAGLESLGPAGSREAARSVAARHAALARELFP